MKKSNNKIRVAIIGNMNNNANNLVKYLIDRGVDATVLFFSNEAGHFTPDADNQFAITYPHRTLSWGGYGQLHTTPAKRIRRDLEPFDFLIGSRLAPAYARKAGRRLDIFMPTGGELHMLPMFSGYAPKDLAKYLFFSRRQRAGIRDSRAIFWDLTNNDVEEKIKPVIDGIDRISHAIPAIYYPDYEGETLARRARASTIVEEVRQLHRDCDVLLWHHVKHVWLPKTIRYYGEFHAKGNDEIVRGLARYYDGSPDKIIKIIMLRFGTDYGETEELARSLNVDQYIHWLPQMPRKELMLAIAECDAVIGEITRSWFSYGTILEAMVMGKPVIHNRDDALYPNKRLYPMLRAFDAASFANALDRIAAGEVDLAAMGREARQWLVEYGIGEPINEIVRRISETEPR